MELLATIEDSQNTVQVLERFVQLVRMVRRNLAFLTLHVTWCVARVSCKGVLRCALAAHTGTVLGRVLLA